MKVRLYAPRAPWDLWKTYFEDWRDAKTVIVVKRTAFEDIIKLFNKGKIVKIEKSRMATVNVHKPARAVGRYPSIPEGVTVSRKRKKR